MEENEKTWIDDLKEEIDINIKPNNHKREITGEKLNTTLKEMVDELSEHTPKSLSELEGDTTHRTVTDDEKQTWGKSAAIFDEQQEYTDAQRLQALANVSNQEAGYDSSDQPVFTGKMGYVVLQPQDDKDLEHTSFAAQIANKPNTIFEIRDVFDLGTEISKTISGNSIELPIEPNLNSLYHTPRTETFYCSEVFNINPSQCIFIPHGSILVEDGEDNFILSRRMYYNNGNDAVVVKLAYPTDNQTLSCMTTEALSLSENSTLKFVGGRIKNAVLVGDSNKVVESTDEIFSVNTLLVGKWNGLILHPENFGVVAGDDDDYIDNYQAMADSAVNSSTVKFSSNKTYYFNYRNDSIVKLNPTRMVFVQKEGLLIDGCGCNVVMKGLDYDTLDSMNDPANGSGCDIFTFCTLLMCKNCEVCGFNGEGDYTPFTKKLRFNDSTQYPDFNVTSPRAKFIGILGSSHIHIHDISAKNIIGNGVNAVAAISTYAIGFKYDGIVYKCFDIKTSNCVIAGMLEGGINYMGNTFNGFIKNCDISSCYDAIETGTENVVIDGNNIYECFIGISCITQNGVISNNQIHDLHQKNPNPSVEIEDATGFDPLGVYLSGRGTGYANGGLVISSNVFNHLPSRAILITAGNRNITINGNIFRDIAYKPQNGKTQCVFFNGINNSTFVENVTISNNVFFIKNLVTAFDIVSGIYTEYNNRQLVPFYLSYCRNFKTSSNLFYEYAYTFDEQGNENIGNVSQITSSRSYVFVNTNTNSVYILDFIESQLAPNSEYPVKSKGIYTSIESAKQIANEYSRNLHINGLGYDMLKFNSNGTNLYGTIILATEFALFQEGDYIDFDFSANGTFCDLLLRYAKGNNQGYVQIDRRDNNRKIIFRPHSYSQVSSTGKPFTWNAPTNFDFTARHRIKILLKSITEGTTYGYKYEFYVDGEYKGELDTNGFCNYNYIGSIAGTQYYSSYECCIGEVSLRQGGSESTLSLEDMLAAAKDVERDDGYITPQTGIANLVNYNYQEGDTFYSSTRKQIVLWNGSALVNPDGTPLNS